MWKELKEDLDINYSMGPEFEIAKALQTIKYWRQEMFSLRKIECTWNGEKFQIWSILEKCMR